MTISPIVTNLRDHPLLRRLCLDGCEGDVTGLDTVLQSDTSKITELDICRSYGSRGPMAGLTRVLQALAHRPTLAKLGLRRAHLGRVEVGLLRSALCNIPSLQSLVLTEGTLRSTALAELASALYRNTSIKVRDLSCNDLNDMDYARLLR